MKEYASCRAPISILCRRWIVSFVAWSLYGCDDDDDDVSHELQGLYRKIDVSRSYGAVESTSSLMSTSMFVEIQL